MEFEIDFNREEKGQLRPYSQQEFLAKLVKDSVGTDIYKKTEPLRLADKRKITVEETTDEMGVNTKITFARIDGDGDVDDTSLEIYYYNRVDIGTCLTKQFPSYPPVKGGLTDLVAGSKIDTSYVAECLTDLLWLEVTSDNLVVPEDGFVFASKPYTEIEVTLKNHPILTGKVTLVFYSPVDSRPTKIFNLGTVETEVGEGITQVQTYLNNVQAAPKNKFERDAIRRRNRLPLYLGD